MSTTAFISSDPGHGKIGLAQCDAVGVDADKDLSDGLDIQIGIEFDQTDLFFGNTGVGATGGRPLDDHPLQSVFIHLADFSPDTRASAVSCQSRPGSPQQCRESTQRFFDRGVEHFESLAHWIESDTDANLLILLIDDFMPDHGGAQRRHPLLAIDQYFSAGR